MARFSSNNRFEHEFLVRFLLLKCHQDSFLEVLHNIWMCFVFFFHLNWFFFVSKKCPKNQKRQYAIPNSIAAFRCNYELGKSRQNLREKKEKNQFEKRLNRFLCYAGHSSEMWNMQYIRSDGRAKGVIENWSAEKKLDSFFFRWFPCMCLFFFYVYFFSPFLRIV